MEFKKGIFLLVVFALFPLNVLAITDDVELKCQSEVMIDNYIDCTVSLRTEQVIKGVHSYFQFDDAFSYVETEGMNNWVSLLNNEKSFAFINTEGVSKNTDIGKIRFMVSNKAELGKVYSIFLKKIVLSDGNKDIYVGEKSAVVKVLSVNNFVQSISIDGKQMELKDGVTDYTVVVDNSITSINLDAVLKNEVVKFVDGFGPRKIDNLKVGNNVFYLKISNDASELITYSINVRRLEKKEEVISNPKTGSSIILIFFVLFFSCGLFFLYIKKLKKRDLI